MTLSELRDLFDADFPAGSVTDSEKLVWFNNACLDIVRKTNCLRSSATASIVANQQEYTVPTDFLMIDPDGGVCWKDGDGYWYRLEAVSLQWLDQNIDNWRNKDAGEPSGYYFRGQVIGLYPTPSTVCTNGLKIYYVEKPNVLSANSDVVFSKSDKLEPYAFLVNTYALWKAKQKRGKFSQGEVYKKEYYEGITFLLREMNFEPDYQQVIRPYFKGKTILSPKQDPLGTL